MTYDKDRGFTDYVHKHLALDIIYRPLNWTEADIDASTLQQLDINNGIDYVLTDLNSGRSNTTQERFRDNYYSGYNDFTIRFEREHNFHEERKLSEYYKIDADYMVYGIINASKQQKEQATDFIKYVVADLKKVKTLIDSGSIVIDRNSQCRVCKMINNVMHCPVNYNGDSSSSFIPIDVGMLYNMLPESIIAVKGYSLTI